MSTLRVRCLPVCAAVLALSACGPEVEVVAGGDAVVRVTRGPRDESLALWGASVTQVAPGVAAVADTPDDTVQLVDVTNTRTQPVRFPAGSRPTRIAPMEDGDFAVVLRGSGQVATVRHGSVRETRSACDEPRGVAWDAEQGDVLVACAGGELVRLTSTGRKVLNVGEELRDVFLAGRTVWVTTFRTAELLELDDEGTVVTRLTPPTQLFTRTAASGLVSLTFTPRVAWRTVLWGDKVVMTHQEHLDDDVTQLTSTPDAPPVPPPYYGTGPGCGSSVVSSAITVFSLSRRAVESSTVLPGALPVDVATDGSSIVVTTSANGGVQIVPWPAGSGTSGCLTTVPAVAMPSPVGAGYVDGALLVLDHDGTVVRTGTAASVIPLRPRATPLTPAEAFFHRQSPSGVACASCHAEGFDDGHTWRFESGAVRTQTLAGGLSVTAPFHWRGELEDLSAVLHTTFERRMGGVLDPNFSTRALGDWIDGLSEKKSSHGDVRAGEAVFRSAGCASCHSGSAFTSNATVDVGTGGAFQVPSLRGLRWRGPWMHDGCAQTLEQRFEPACGGKRHGTVSPADVPKLVAYLKSL